MSGIFGIWQHDGAFIEPSKVRLSTEILRSSRDEQSGYLFIDTRSGAYTVCSDPAGQAFQQLCSSSFNLIIGYYRPAEPAPLSPARLPGRDPQGRIFFIYDGELYNKQQLKEDLMLGDDNTAGLMATCFARYGIEGLAKLNGLFCAAVWDVKNTSLTIARDPVGGRPAFYCRQPDRFIFSTHIKSILAGKWAVAEANLRAIRDFVGRAYPATTETWFAGIRRLMSGTCVVVASDRLREERYWQADYHADSGVADAEYVERLRHEIGRAVAIRRQQTEGICAHLSGGVDSSTVVSILARQMAPVQLNTYTGYYASYADDSRFDETKYAAAVAGAAKANHTLLKVDFEQLPEILPKVIYLLEEPYSIGAYSQYCVFKDTAADGCKVVFVGEGGDELFASYRHHVTAAVLQQFFPIPHLYNIVADRIWPGIKDLKFLLSGYFPFRQLLGKEKEALKDAPFNKACFNHNDTSLSDFICHPRPRGYLNQQMVDDFAVELPCLMQMEHNLAIAFGMRLRAPLTDLNIVRLAQSLPVRMRVRGRTTKYCLRLAGEGFVTKEVIWRTNKMGFPAPFGLAVRRPNLINYCKELLAGPSSPEIFNRDYILRIIDEHICANGTCGQKADHESLLWRLMYIAEWFRVFGVRL
jgi:asparagine synthase (glutamine-hydrolysing)